jgi:hypothetical protein
VFAARDKLGSTTKIVTTMIRSSCSWIAPDGSLYVERMLPTAPSKLDSLIVARTAAEEIDHFHRVARVAGDMGVDVAPGVLLKP